MKGIDFMMKEGVSNIDYRKLAILTDLHMFNLQYNDIKQIHEALQKGTSYIKHFGTSLLSAMTK